MTRIEHTNNTDIPFIMEQVYDAPIEVVWQALADEIK